MVSHGNLTVATNARMMSGWPIVGHSEVEKPLFSNSVCELCARFRGYSVRKNGQSDLRPISHSLFDQPEYPCFDAARVRQLCASLASQGGNSMARKVGQIIARGDRRWLIRVYLGRDHETKKRNYHNRTIHGSLLFQTTDGAKVGSGRTSGNYARLDVCPRRRGRPQFI